MHNACARNPHGVDSLTSARPAVASPRAWEILNGKRALTVDMIHKLNREWGVPADVLVAPYRLAA